MTPRLGRGDGEGMKTLDLFWMHQNSWAVIFTGEGAASAVVEGKYVPDELHDGMCCCRKSLEVCGDECVKEVLEEMKDSEEWTFDESGRPFEFYHEFEIGGVTVVRIDVIKSGGVAL